MLLFGSNLLFFCFMVVSARGKVNLEIIKNENGDAITVLSFIETRNGANFSLECRVIDSKGREKMNDQIVWQKKNWKLTFAEVHNIKMLENTTVGATMTFIPVTIKNQGQYVCVSPKYNLRKVIFVEVRPEFSSFNFKTTAHSLRYFNTRRKRSNGSVRDSIPVGENSNIDKFSTTSGKKASDDFKNNQWDVKKVKLHEENDTQTSSVRYHDGTTDIFRIGLIVSFVLLAMIGIYRIFRCWRSGTLGPLSRRARASSATPYTQNNCENICDSNQTTITTNTIQNKDINTSTVVGFRNSLVNGINQNEHVENADDSLTWQQVTFLSTCDESNFDKGAFKVRFESLGKNC